MSATSFDAKAELTVGDRTYSIFRLDALQAKFDVARLPFSLKVLLENLLRNEDGGSIRSADIEALASWNATGSAEQTNTMNVNIDPESVPSTARAPSASTFETQPVCVSNQ